jgi:hypothetical protein
LPHPEIFAAIVSTPAMNSALSMHRNRRAKIVATVGPASASPDI